MVDALRLNGHDVVEAVDGLAGLDAAIGTGVDLVLLDLMLPGRDGLEVLAHIRQRISERPVIILTARGGEDDRVRGLDMGADDYVVKPFSARELLARVDAVLRRCYPHPPERLCQVRLAHGSLDFDRRELRWTDGTRLDLSETEAELLRYLFTHPDRAVSREELLSRVWGIQADNLETRTVDMHIARLRAKLRHPEGNGETELIVTVRGIGYMVTASSWTATEEAVS